MLHPLVSPLAAKDWRGAPPIFFSVGQEMLRDENAVLARRLATQDVKVVWREFEAMPHVFAMMVGWTPQARLHVEETAKFCRDVIEDPGKVESEGKFIKAKTLVRESIDLTRLTDLTDEKVAELMREGQGRLKAKGGDGSVETRPML